MLVHQYGVTLYDKKRTTPGYTLFSRNGSDQVWLINLDGDVVHDWKTRGGTTHFNYLRPNGNLVVCELADD